MFIFEKLIERSQHKRIANVACTGRHQILIHIVAIMLHKESQHHYHGAGISFPEGMNLPNRGKQAGKLMHKLLSADADP